MKWEYLIARQGHYKGEWEMTVFPPDGARSERIEGYEEPFSQLGEQGWELVSMVPEAWLPEPVTLPTERLVQWCASDYRLVFKRPVAE